MSPTQRSLAWFRKMGIPCGIVERWIPQIKKRIDLFNFADAVAIVPGSLYNPESDDGISVSWIAGGPGHILALQITSDNGGNLSSRVKKILSEPRAKLWLEAGGRICVHGWAKKGPAGKRKTWTLRSVPVTLADFAEPPIPSETGRTEDDPDQDSSAPCRIVEPKVLPKVNSRRKNSGKSSGPSRKKDGGLFGEE